MKRRTDIDLLKGISIIAVVLYHIGILPYGYLGVDIFIVISGFLIVPPVIDKISTCDYHYFSWLWKRLSRFIPLMIIICAVALILGLFIMTPDDYQNLSQSTVASEIFANNILLSITTKNYWALENEYNPLLALWYLGLVVQFMVLFPLYFLCTIKIFRYCNKKKVLCISLLLLGIVSLLLNTSPSYDFYIKFYNVPFRAWEFCIGAGVCFVSRHFKRNLSLKIYSLVLIILLVLLSLRFTPIQEISHVRVVGYVAEPFWIETSFLQISLVLLTAILLTSTVKLSKIFTPVIYLGKISLSIFLWHQLILGFMRYCIADMMTLPMVLSYIAGVIAISVISYNRLEKAKVDNKTSKAILFSAWSLVMCASLFICHKSGEIIEMPAIGATKENWEEISRLDGATYNERYYTYDRPFSTDKIKVLVIGNSYARDLANTLDEWDKEDSLEISYIFKPEGNDPRYGQARYIFWFGDKSWIPQWIWDSISPDCEVFGIGTKNFGTIIGTLYIKKRLGEFNYSMRVPQKLRETNDKWKTRWGEHHYIDYVKASLDENGNIRVFTPDSMYISFDCLHLAPAGAKYFSSRLGFDSIFRKSTNP